MTLRTRGSSRGGTELGRWPLYALPLSAVVFAAFTLVTAGTTSSYRVARVWGGPTGGGSLTLRVEVFDVVEEPGGGVEESPAPGGGVRAYVRAKGFEATRTSALDPEGGAELRFEPPAGARALDVSIAEGGTELASGPIGLTAARWASVARRRGGWSAAAAGPFELRVAPARGALAVPFDEELCVGVARDGAPVARALVRASAGGAQIAPAEATTDARGLVRFHLTPEEHVPSVTLAIEADAERGQASFGLPVVPGALRARLDHGELVVEAPVPRDVAYFALVTERERLQAGRLTLAPNAHGGSDARVPIPRLPSEPVYAVVSSERDLRSPSAVGWPLALGGAEPLRTFDAVEALLLDGRPRVALRERARRSRVRWATAAFCAAALFLEIVLLLRLTRASARALDRHLEDQGVGPDDAERLSPARSGALIVALAAIALGFLVVALVAFVKLR